MALSGDIDLRLARVEARLARLEEHNDTLERALTMLMPECNGEPGACPHCAATRELDAMPEPEDEPAQRATA